MVPRTNFISAAMHRVTCFAKMQGTPTCTSKGSSNSSKAVWTTTNGLRPPIARVYAFGTGFCMAQAQGVVMFTEKI